MGAAWCRERAAAASDSKSPLDRVIVRCVGQVYPPERAASPSTNNGVDVVVNHDVTSPFPRTEVSAPPRVMSSDWEEVTLQVPERGHTPVPPPRKKRLQQPARRKNGMSRPPPPKAPASSDHLLSPDRHRPKNLSTVSLPDFNELHETRTKPASTSLLQTPSGPSRAPSLSSLSEATAERLENYMRRCRSFGSMAPDQLLEKLNQSRRSSSDSEDRWAGLDDWDLGVVEHNHHHDGEPSVSPTSKLHERPRRKPTPEKQQPSDKILFLDNANEEDWFQDHWPSKNNDAPSKEEGGVKDEAELSNVKKELQSIIYDYNRCKKVSTSSMEVLPTQPVRVAKKKISVTSVTPPPSPEGTDPGEDIPLSTVINGEDNNDDSSHSTLLRILKAYQSMEDELEGGTSLERELGVSVLPAVHNGPVKTSGNTREGKVSKEQSPLEKVIAPEEAKDASAPSEVKPDIEQKVKSSDVDAEKSIKPDIVPVATTVKDAESLLNELENRLGHKMFPAVSSTGEAVKKEQKMELVQLEAGVGLGSRGSSNRSSMTPSLSELEAALSDMLEKSTEEEDSTHQATPVPNGLTKPVPMISVSSEPFTDDMPVFQDKHVPTHPVAASALRHAGEVH